MAPSLSRRQKWLYGFGDISFSLTNTILAVYFAIFLTDVVGLPARLAAAAIFLGRSWDYINDPLVGHLSDRVRTRWGRRRPFLLFGALPFALGFILLWSRPGWQNPYLLTAYHAFAYMFYDAAFTLVNMPYIALTPELTDDYDERTSLTSYRMFFSILGSLVAFTLPLALVGSFSPENAWRAARMGVIFGLLSILPVLLVFFSARERAEFMDAGQARLGDSLRAAFRNRPFIFGAGIFLLTWVAVDILQTTLLYFLKYVLQREAQSDLIMAAIFITAMLALPLWTWASRHWNKRLAYICGIAFWAAVQLVLVSLDASASLACLLGLCVLAGVGVSAAHVLPWAIIPDAVEWDEWHTGERHEGMFYSLITLMQKAASSAAVPLALLLMDAAGYIPNAARQSPGALLGIRLAVGPAPAALLCAGILFALLYPLSRAEHARLVAELEQRRRQKGATAAGLCPAAGLEPPA